MRDPCDAHGRSMDYPWVTTGRPRATHGLFMGNLWVTTKTSWPTHGPPVGDPWAITTKPTTCYPWDNHGP